MSSRDLVVAGLGNARDLGGLPRESGGETRRGRIFRSARPDALDAEGWRALRSAGIRTVVDLRRDDEGTRPVLEVDIVRQERSIEDGRDAEFLARWQRDLGTPAYYADAVARWEPEVVAALNAIATAPIDGAVLLHCSAGRDRTGMISALVLEAASVPREIVLEDYASGVRGFNALLPLPEAPHERPRNQSELAALLPERLADLRAFLDGKLPASVRDAAARAAERLR